MLRPIGRSPRCRMVCLAAIAAAGLITGCNRSYYRRQADREAPQLVAEKSYDPRWALDNFSITMDPRSRYFDPYDLDRPPMPPDDPDSHKLMHCVDGKRGYKYWHAGGNIDQLENPGWREMLPEYMQRTPDGAIRLTLNDAVELATIQSPDYQQQLETIYLSALDVSTERFSFEVQYFGGNGTGFEHLGRLRGAGGETNTLRTDTDAQLSREFATAGELLIGFANSFVWQFAGPDTNATTSLLNFALVQPLLRSGGRVIALEQLTIAERALLANLRAMQRYRQGFYTDIAIGDSGVIGPQRRGGFFGGTGLTGFSGQGEAGFGGVGQATGFGRGGAGGAAGGAAGAVGFAGGGAGQVGGFLGQLQQLRQIRNTETSLRAQQLTLELLEAHVAAGLIDLAQVDQFRQNIESERATLLQNQNAYANSAEAFITGTLGLPPSLPVEFDDSAIQQFELINPDVSELEGRIGETLAFVGSLPEKPKLGDLKDALARVPVLFDGLAEQFKVADEDLKRMDANADMRMTIMNDAERDAYRQDRRRLSDALESLHEHSRKLQQTLKDLDAGLKPETIGATADGLVALLAEMTSVVGELSLIQARARLESIGIEQVHLDPDDAVSIARANRLDWMNNRAALVDTWRLIEYNANALEADVDIVFDGDIQTTGNNPVKFRAPTGSLRASIRFDAPFTRLVERNNFRQQLIAYQQARRQEIQYEDGVMFSLRRILRDLDQLSINLEIQRRAVIIAIRRVDQTREVLNQPAPPSLPGQPPTQFGPTAAINLLTALSDLRNSQNNFLSVWLNYYASRMLLYRELGIMQLDEKGLWVDEPLEQALRAHSSDAVLPPEVEVDWGPEGAPLEMHSNASESAPPLPAPPLLAPPPGTLMPTTPSDGAAREPETFRGWLVEKLPRFGQHHESVVHEAPAGTVVSSPAKTPEHPTPVAGDAQAATPARGIRTPVFPTSLRVEHDGGSARPASADQTEAAGHTMP